MKYEVQYLLLGKWQHLRTLPAASRRKAMKLAFVQESKKDPQYRGQIKVTKVN